MQYIKLVRCHYEVLHHIRVLHDYLSGTNHLMWPSSSGSGRFVLQYHKVDFHSQEMVFMSCTVH